MAKRLVDFEFTPTGRRGKYPWYQWFDGAAWELCYGEDFHVEPEQFLSLVHGAASRKGGKARTQKDGDRVVIQFYRKEQL